MQNWLPWLPLPRHWLNALALMVLMAGLQFVSGYLGGLFNWLIGLLPRFGYALVVLAFLARTVIAAYLYQFESAVKQHLIAVGAGRSA